jgi:hypothetical protein
LRRVRYCWLWYCWPSLLALVLVLEWYWSRVRDGNLLTLLTTAAPQAFLVRFPTSQGCRILARAPAGTAAAVLPGSRPDRGYSPRADRSKAAEGPRAITGAPTAARNQRRPRGAASPLPLGPRRPALWSPMSRVISSAAEAAPCSPVLPFKCTARAPTLPRAPAVRLPSLRRCCGQGTPPLLRPSHSPVLSLARVLARLGRGNRV